MIECVPNVSEGQHPEVVVRLADALRHESGVRLLDFSSDRSHNRSVFTLAGDEPGLERAVIALYGVAIAEIDLRNHRGEHPRIGAVDVVPFVPLGGATMAGSVALARRVGAAIADRFAVPIYLYGEAASDPRRRSLEDIRRGQFEGLADKMAQPEWVPDFGPRRPHPSAGASAVGARGPLIAYNVNLATDRLEVARAVAAAIRHRDGGLPSIKALGIPLRDRHIVQVTTNLTDYHRTSLEELFDAVAREAEARGVAVLESEFVGLVPAEALPPDAAARLRLARFSEDQVLEKRLKTFGFEL